jgi:hypothetical protein
MFLSSTVTRAPVPTAICSALVPTTPAPMITMWPAATPGTPPSSNPMPPFDFSRWAAPAWIAIRPATSLIGASRGKPPPAPVMVSYAMQIAPDLTSAAVCSGSGARCR